MEGSVGVQGPGFYLNYVSVKNNGWCFPWSPYHQAHMSKQVVGRLVCSGLKYSRAVQSDWFSERILAACWL